VGPIVESHPLRFSITVELGLLLSLSGVEAHDDERNSRVMNGAICFMVRESAGCRSILAQIRN